MPFVFSVKDSYRQAVEAASGGRNTVMYDDTGYPSIMVRVPKFYLDEVIAGAPHRVHPAFLVNGVEKNEIWIGKYQAVIHNGRAYSLPGQDPAVSINFNNALNACRAKGPGWHLMTSAEWAAIALWCHKAGFIPRGNTSNGASSDATYERGVKATAGTDYRVLTGSGPATWNHDGTPSGISDLCGNVWEWVAGLRLMNGEIQIIPENDAVTADLSEASTAWRAILQDGTLVGPGTAGTLKYDSELAQDDDNVVDVAGKPVLNTTLANPAPGTWGSTTYQDYNFSAFESPRVATGVTAPDILKWLAIYPHATGLGGDGLWTRNYGERVALRGGSWDYAGSAGVFALQLRHPRSHVNWSVGFRPAFVP